jgi:acylphosphatase
MAKETREIKRLMIRGVVQGIGFRAWSEREALALGLRGWVRNRVDGSVEMVLAGAPDQIAAMVERCRKGPPLSKVEAVEVEDAAMLDLGLRRPGEAFSLIATK